MTMQYKTKRKNFLLFVLKKFDKIDFLFSEEWLQISTHSEERIWDKQNV